MRRVTTWLLVGAVVCGVLPRHVRADETVPAVEDTNSAPADSHDVSARRRALQTIRAAAANVVPGVSAFTEPKCIQGYILCKAMFAGFSVVAAAESVLMSGGRDHEQPKGILTKGFTGDWFITPSDIAGTTKAELLPEVAAKPSGEDKGGFVPPPL